MKYVREIKIGSGECDRIRKDLLRYVNPKMNGIDIGSNGCPLFLQSISIDTRVDCYLSELVQLKGDAIRLPWFRDGVLDYAFSSHCLEDFSPDKKILALKEWARVVKSKGYVILYLPDEKRYRDYCRKVGTGRNQDHTDENFNMNTIKKIVKENLTDVLQEVLSQEYEPYNFLLVYNKI